MPNDHTYGVITSKEKLKVDEIIKNKYCNDDKPDLLLNVEKTYKPQFVNNRLKPPKPTTSSKLRKEKMEQNKTETSKMYKTTSNLLNNLSLLDLEKKNKLHLIKN